LSSEVLNLTAGKWDEAVGLQEIKNTLTQQVCHDADMVSEIEAVTEVNAFVSVAPIIRSQRGQHS
jgi:hypothetical protein